MLLEILYYNLKNVYICEILIWQIFFKQFIFIYYKVLFYTYHKIIFTMRYRHFSFILKNYFYYEIDLQYTLPELKPLICSKSSHLPFFLYRC